MNDIAQMPFAIGGPLEPSLAFSSNGFRDILRQM